MYRIPYDTTIKGIGHSKRPQPTILPGLCIEKRVQNMHEARSIETKVEFDSYYVTKVAKVHA